MRTHLLLRKVRHRAILTLAIPLRTRPGLPGWHFWGQISEI